MTRGEIWKDFFKRTVLPAVIALFLFFMFKNVFTEDGQTNYFYVWLCCGIPFGIRRMFVWLVPHGYDIAGTVGIIALNFILGGIIGGASFIKCGTLSASKNCGLAKFIRKRLRKRGLEISRINCVYSDEQVCLPETALAFDGDDASAGRVRHTLGSLPTITAIFGLTIANYVITSLSGHRRIN